MCVCVADSTHDFIRAAGPRPADADYSSLTSIVKFNLLRCRINKRLHAFAHDSVSIRPVYTRTNPCALNLTVGSSVRYLKSTESIIATFTVWARRIWRVLLSHVRPLSRENGCLCMRGYIYEYVCTCGSARIKCRRSLVHTVTRN